jgi:dephospho-CoA kinase
MTHIKKRIIGLTGGIATGKSTVCEYLANKYQIPVLDADIYSREAVMPNSPILPKIFERYGNKIITGNQELNRQALGDIIFNNSQEKEWLESQIHPFVYERFINELNQIKSQIIVLAIPLLFEAKMTDLVTEIWVVICSLSQQIIRLQTRNNLTEKQALARINSQLPLAEKIALADVVLDNNQDLDSLFFQVDSAFHNLSFFTQRRKDAENL